MADAQIAEDDGDRVPVPHHLAFNKRAILDALKTAGVETAEIEFDGGRDVLVRIQDHPAKPIADLLPWKRKA